MQLDVPKFVDSEVQIATVRRAKQFFYIGKADDIKTRVTTSHDAVKNFGYPHSVNYWPCTECERKLVDEWLHSEYNLNRKRGSICEKSCFVYVMRYNYDDVGEEEYQSWFATSREKLEKKYGKKFVY